MCDFTTWNMVESAFEMVSPMEQDAEKVLDPDLNWVISTELQGMEAEKPVGDTDEMESVASASSLNAPQPLIDNVLLEKDLTHADLVPIESLLRSPPELVLMNQPAVGVLPPTTPSTDEGSKTTVSSSATLRVALRDLAFQGQEHLVPGNYILPEYMLRSGYPVPYLRCVDAECNGTVCRLYILSSGSCTTQAATYIPPFGGGLNEVLKLPIEVQPQSLQGQAKATSIEHNDDKDGVRDDANSSSASVQQSTAATSANQERLKLREYLELQINNITIPVLTAGSKKVGTKHTRKASVQK
ncbi:uncharacterized protein LOC118456644 [Anopheles albimanus]|uniref:Uncharacterized protein n=1 Tax=Anopheles albimanus TaxID=7167 RepID=A0A182FQQ1_ANOAL|nr:uncharacterized protein LOC118456644 [Anopheles albimanus]